MQSGMLVRQFQNTLLRSTCAFALLSAAAPAFAQNQSASETTLSLEEIVVNARRVEENLQRVPIAISAVSPDAIEKQQITDVSALAAKIPSLNMCCNQGNTSFGFLRGATGVAYYFNDVPVGTAGSSGYGNFFDIQNAQVLKGPQGTLFGTASNAGAILYNPVRPGNEMTGYAAGTVGSLGRTVAEGALTIPLIDDMLSIRLAGKSEHRDGTWRVLSHPGLKIEDRNYQVFRASVVYKPTDRIENYTMFNYYRDHNKPSPAGVLTDILPANYTYNGVPGGNRAPALYYGFGGAGNSAPVGRVPNNENNYNQNIFAWFQEQVNQPGGLYDYTLPGLSFIPSAKSWRINLTNHTTFDITDDLSIKNIFGYSKRFSFAHTDTDGTPYTLQETGAPPSRAASPISDWTNEVQLQGNAIDNRLKFTLGTFWYGPSSWGSDRGRNHSRVVTATGPITAASTVSKTASRGKAVYGQGTYDLSEMIDGLSLTAGYRHSWDKAFQNQWVYPVLYNQPGCYNDPVSGLCMTSSNTPTVTRAGGGKWDKGSYTFSGQYQLDPSTMLFATYSKGSSAGGLQLNAPTPELRSYGPASLTNLEGGVKSQFNVGDTQVRFNATAFYGWYDDIAVQVVRTYVQSPGAPPTLTVITENAAKARLHGVDFETTVIPTDWLEMYFNGAYNKFKFTTWNGINPVTQLIQDMTSTNIQYTPKFKFSLGATVHIPIPERLGAMSISADYMHQGITYVALVPQANADDIPGGMTNRPYQNMDMALDWSNFYGADGLSLQFYVTNVLKDKTATGTNGGIYGLGYDTDTDADPRMFGVTARYKF